MLSFYQARERLLANVKRVALERVSLSHSAGRVIAQDLVAPLALPAYDFSAMDGYAVVAETFRGEGPWTLRSQGISRAGHEPPGFESGTACRIFTGAQLPQGADTVVMQERVQIDGDRVTFNQQPKRGEHVRRAGEDLAQGALALMAGTRLHAGHLALAAMLGQAELCVSKRPVVTILCSGDELRAPGSVLGRANIFDANSAALGALAQQAGAAVYFAPFVPDDPAATVSAISRALDGTDLLVTVGGVSVGDHDLVRPALEQAGIEVDFWKVAIKPGKPLVVGRNARAHVLGLPGNPASAVVTFALFGMPLLRAMQGDRAAMYEPCRARLTRDVAHSPGRLEFARAQVEVDGGELKVTVHDNQSSGAATSLAWCNGLALLPGETNKLAAGERIEVVRFADL